MDEHALSQKLHALAEPLAASLGLSVWGAEVGIGGRSLLRVYVEAEGGVDINTCAELSRMLGLSLDVDELLPGPYTLEISSPGLERVFFTPGQLEPYAGKEDEYFDLWLYEPVSTYPQRRKFTGRLQHAENGIFTFEPEDAPGPGQEILPITFSWGDIKKIQRIHRIPEPSGPGKGRKGKKSGGNPAEKKSLNVSAAETPESDSGGSL